MEMNLMAEQATIAPDNPQGTESNATSDLSVRQGDEAIASMLGNLLGDNPEDEGEHHEAETTETDAGNPEEDNPEPETGVAEEVEEVPETDPAQGRFAADDANVKLDDGRVVSIADLKKGSMLQPDYSRKTEELAREKQEFNQSRERHDKEREFMAYFIGKYVPQPPEAPQVSADTDPVAWLQYSQAKVQYDQMLGDWEQYKKGHETEWGERQAQSQAQLRKQAEAEQQRFAKVFPSLKDNGKREAFWNRLQKGGEHYGLSVDQVRSIPNVDLIRMLNDATAYRELKAKSATTQQEVKGRPQTINGSGQRQTPGAQAERSMKGQIQRLRETGSVRDADAALLAFIK